MRCRICGKPLTGQGAFLGIGPVCRKHRAEAMRLALVEGTGTIYKAPLPTHEEFKQADNFVIVNYDALQPHLPDVTPRITIADLDQTDDEWSYDEKHEVVDFDELRGWRT